MATETPLCDFGRPAVDFALADTAGKRHTLATLRGPNGLLLMFICNHCPFVKAAIDRICRDARELQALGVGVAAIMSNDATQDVARACGAVCTPDFFGFNAALQLQYRGRLDACGRAPAAPDTRRELFEAMRMIAASGNGPREQAASIGCSIKWRS